MKTKTIILTVMLAVLLSGCLVKSLHPFYNESDVIYKQELTGTWLDEDSARWVISRFSFTQGLFKGDSLDNSYFVELYEDSLVPSKFNVHLFSLDGLLYLDFLPVRDDSGKELYDIHLVPAHTLARVNFDDNDRMTISWFNEDWLNRLFEENRLKISHEVINSSAEGYGTQYVLTASTDELKKFIVKYGNDPNVFMCDDDKNFLCLKLNKQNENQPE
jgi:hypothetical protein